MATKSSKKKNLKASSNGTGSYCTFITDQGFFVMEVGGIQTIAIAKFKKKTLADRMCSMLNSGNGFAGFTPPFMAIKPPVLMEVR